MKKQQLEELLHLITRRVIKEFSSMQSASDFGNGDSSDSSDSSNDANISSTDAMTTAEKAKAARDIEITRQKQIKQKQVELDAKKKEVDFNKKKLDMQKRFDIPNMTKNIQKLKGAKI